MHDIAARWQVEPDWAHAVLEAPTIRVGAVTGVTQRFVSGDTARFLASHDLENDVGGPAFAFGKRYAVRVARDRLLVIGFSAAELADGWHDEGYAVSTVSSGLRLFEAEGDGVSALLARAATINPDNPGPCAAMLFCGVMSIVYWHTDKGTLRFHVDRGLSAYLWEWLQCQPIFSQEKQTAETV